MHVVCAHERYVYVRAERKHDMHGVRRAGTATASSYVAAHRGHKSRRRSAGSTSVSQRT